MSAATQTKLEIVYTLTVDSEVQLHSVRNGALYLARSREEAGDLEGSGAFQLLADSITSVIAGLSEEIRELA